MGVKNIPNQRLNINTKILNQVDKYSILHMGSSIKERNLPIETWFKLSELILKDNITPILTGYGKMDKELTDKLKQINPKCLNTCNQLNWDELVALLSKAENIISVETSVGHLAASLDKPVISIYGGMSDNKQWKPYGDKVKVVSNFVPCNPCFKKRGCDNIICLSGITAEKIFSEMN